MTSTAPEENQKNYSDTPLTPPIKYLAWGLLGLYIIAHLLPYLPRYAMPHYDYANVLHVINSLESPGLFAGSNLSEVLVQSSTVTAPIYFFGLTYPLSTVLPAKWSLYVIGITITAGCAYFAGYRWTTQSNLIMAVLVLMLLLHSTVSPLEGNRRSFTAFFLLGTLWLEEYESYPLRMLMTACAAGIYPPVGLLMLTYFGLRYLEDVYDGRARLRRTLLKTAGLAGTFALVLTPYLYDLLLGANSSVSRVTLPIVYKLDSITGWANTFLLDSVGDGFTRGALFRDQVHFDFVLILLTLLVVEWILLASNFTLRSRYGLLVVASLMVWGLAHLVHPLIYHPFKYTRLSLPLALAFPVAENLPNFTGRLRRRLEGHTGLRVFMAGAAAGTLALWGLYRIVPSGFSFLKLGGLPGPEFIGFLFALPVFIAFLVFLPDSWQNPALRSLLAVLVLMLMVVVPHNIHTIDLGGLKLADMEGLFQYLRATPGGTVVTGPPLFFMDFIPAFASRPVYSSNALTPFGFVCERNRTFWSMYFSGSPQQIRQFMVRNEIDYLLVDRATVRNQQPYGARRCDLPASPPEAPYLDQQFEGAAWKMPPRLYLVDPETLAEPRTRASRRPSAP